MRTVSKKDMLDLVFLANDQLVTHLKITRDHLGKLIFHQAGRDFDSTKQFTIDHPHVTLVFFR